MKNLKKALIASAVLAGLAGTNAYAGTEACFEVVRGDYIAANGAGNNANITTLGDIYSAADCKGAEGVALADAKPGKLAYEMTSALELDFENMSDLNPDNLQVIYIPTSDIPSGTLIEMELGGAEFFDNGNQIHLVRENGDDSLSAVASSDGTLDGTNVVRFVVKAGIDVSAGTRLALSQAAAGADIAALKPIKIKLTNTGCTDSTSAAQVSLTATSAVTDGGTGYSIEGGESAANTILDISPQFVTFYDHMTSEAEVNAESANSLDAAIVARTEFVYDAKDPANTLIARQHQVVYPADFYNRAPTLDKSIGLVPGDNVETQFISSIDPGASVQMAIWNIQDTAATVTGELSSPVEVEDGVTYGDFGLTEAAAPVYLTDAADLFTAVEDGTEGPEANPYDGTADETKKFLDGADFNKVFYTLTNEPSTGVMNFNYEVTTKYTLDFQSDDYLDHCAESKNTHDIGVNGAVLKVPYVFDNDGNFVRITNEHTDSAEVTVDVFGESADGETGDRHVVAVTLGTIPAKSSVVYFVPKLIEEAAAAGYTGADGGFADGQFGANASSNGSRHSLTFTVTAPRDSVHGISVQKQLSGADRVMPVLDQNVWNQ